MKLKLMIFFNKLNAKEIVSHHEKVKKNFVFIALKGSNYDGTRIF